MGTPKFAVPTLRRLILSKEHNVVAVFSQQPKPQGRGLKIMESPVCTLASFYKIPIYTPTTLTELKAFKLISGIIADIIVVVAYGLLIPKNVIESKKYGCLNIHPSKLPKYRGAAPLHRTIINGEKNTAVSVIQMDEGLDTGDIILQEEFDLDEKTTLQSLHDKCAQIGSELLLKILNNIHGFARTMQPTIGKSYAHKLTKEEGRVVWSHHSAFQIDCMVRGMSPWPGVFFKVQNQKITILEVEVFNIHHSFIVGQVLNNSFCIACTQDVLRIHSLKPEGKKQMSGTDYLHGHRNIVIGSTILI